MYKSKAPTKKVARLDDKQCLALGNSAEGSVSLRNPNSSSSVAENSSRINERLTPRNNDNLSQLPIRTAPAFEMMGSVFVTARTLHDPTSTISSNYEESTSVAISNNPDMSSTDQNFKIESDISVELDLPSATEGSDNLVSTGELGNQSGAARPRPQKRSKLISTQKNKINNYFSPTRPKRSMSNEENQLFGSQSLPAFDQNSSDFGFATASHFSNSLSNNSVFNLRNNFDISNLPVNNNGNKNSINHSTSNQGNENLNLNYSTNGIQSQNSTNATRIFSCTSGMQSSAQNMPSCSSLYNGVTVIRSPMAKVPGTQSICYCPSTSPLNSSNGSSPLISSNGITSRSSEATSTSAMRNLLKSFNDDDFEENNQSYRTQSNSIWSRGRNAQGSSGTNNFSSQNKLEKIKSSQGNLKGKQKQKGNSKTSRRIITSNSVGESSQNSVQSSGSFRSNVSYSKSALNSASSGGVNRSNGNLGQNNIKLESHDNRGEGRNTFGLLGDEVMCISEEESDENGEAISFSHLPLEIVENIFCRLPFIDLCLNVNRVCIAWRDIIASDRFIEWKKRYYRLLKSPATGSAELWNVMKDQNMTNKKHYLPQLIRMMKTYKKSTDHRGMNASLQGHSKYRLAVDILKDRLPDCFTNSGSIFAFNQQAWPRLLIKCKNALKLNKDKNLPINSLTVFIASRQIPDSRIERSPNPWCLVVMLVVISERVSDITELFVCLLTQGQGQVTAVELLDFLYCVATFLLLFKNLEYKDLWTSMHYRLYYALYLYENESVCMSSQLQNVLENQRGQQSIRRYGEQRCVRLTHEQMRICNHDISHGQVVKIVAFAGTGKTTTLVEYTRLRPAKKFLMVVFNKAVCEHAKTRFPANVVCSTSHSLAWKSVGWKYQKEGKIGGNMRITEIIDHACHHKGLSMYVQAKFVIDTLKNFMASADPCILESHMPNTVNHSSNTHHCSPELRTLLLYDAEKIWKKMADFNDKTIKLTHDAYLKLWQLRNPQLKGYDVILIDEAQDLTPAVADVFAHQSLPRILVGDPHQQIYSFRGAVNAMQLMNPTHTFYLTQSFRFGPEISYIAATILELYKSEKKQILVGNGIQDGVNGERVGQLAIITRTNFQLFSEAVNLCSFNDNDFKIAFAGGLESFGIDMILDIYYLLTEQTPEKKAENIRNPLIRRFILQGFGEFERYAEGASDVELLGKIRIVKTYQLSLPGHIDRITKKCVRDLAFADIVLSTAHKSKGLEFDTVRVADDFLQDVTRNAATDQLNNQQLEQVPADEFNLLYVAVTRAKKRLQLSKALISLLNRATSFTYIADQKSVVNGMTVSSSQVSSTPPGALEAWLSATGACLVHRGVNHTHFTTAPDVPYNIEKDTVIPLQEISNTYHSVAALVGNDRPAECRVETENQEIQPTNPGNVTSCKIL